MVKAENTECEKLSLTHLGKTLDFSSGHDITVPETEPRTELYANIAEPDWDLSLSLCEHVSPPISLSASPPLMHIKH